MDFPSPHMRLASAAVHIVGASILAYCFAARTRSGHITLKNWRQVPWARWCLILVFADSWLFHVCAGLLIQGPGASNNEVTCTMAIFLCIIIYCLSKVLIYSFLIERVYVVWPHNGTRLSSKAYCFCLFLMAGYGVIATLMIVGRNAFFGPDHNCIIGLKRFASIPLISYDLFINVFLTSMFLWPLQQAHFRERRLRKFATRTLLAAFVALTTSSVNMGILIIVDGQEQGWICLVSCGLDVTVNALVLYWVTGYRPDDHSSVPYLTTISFTLPYSTNDRITSSHPDPLAPPDLSVPEPVRDKAKPYRPSPVVASRAAVTSQADERMSERTGDRPTRERSGARDPSIDHPVARASTIESVHCEMRTDRLAPGFGRRMHADGGWHWWRWRWRSFREERRREEQMKEPGLHSGVPFVVKVTTVHQVHDDSLSSYSSERRDSGSSEGGQEVYQ